MNTITRGTQVRGVLKCTPARGIGRTFDVKKSVKTLLVSSALLALMSSSTKAQQVPERIEPPAGIQPPARTEPAVERDLGRWPDGRRIVRANLVTRSPGCRFSGLCVVWTDPCDPCPAPQ